MKSFIIFIALMLGISACFAQSSAQQNKIVMLNQLSKEIKQSPNNVRLLLNAGMLCHQLAIKDKKYVEEGENYFKKALSIDPNLSIAKAWYGSLLTIEGKYSLMPWNKLKDVQRGLNVMDAAVKSDRNNVAVRMVRGDNNLALPKFFNRIDSAIVDLRFVVSELKSNKKLQSKYNLAQQYLRLADAYQIKGQTDKSKKIWKNVSANFPGTEAAKISDTKLATLK